MNNIEKYKVYRKTAKKLVNKIMKSSLDRDTLMKSANLLGISQGDTLIFENEDQTSVLMDFALNDYKVDNKNTIEIYREQVGFKNDIEKDLLDSLLQSYTSLFKVVFISAEEKALILRDILNRRENIRLIDIGFSRTAVPGLILFLRLVSFENFTMTSGVCFVFPGNLEKYLIRRYHTLSKKIKSDDESIKRFVTFFRLNKTDGIDVKYE